MKRILYISHRIPYPPNKGDKIRSFHEIRSLSSEYKVDLVTFVDSKTDNTYKTFLTGYCHEIHTFYINKAIGIICALFFFILGRSLSEGYYFNIRAFFRIRSLINSKEYEAIFCYSAQVAQYVLAYNNRKRIMDFVDVDSDKWKQYSTKMKFPLRIIYKIESRRLLNFEKIISNRFTMSFFSTDLESKIFKDYGAEGEIFVVNNGVDSEYFQPVDTEKEQALVFIGAMDYYPNIDAVTWFINEVFFILLKQLPDLKFYIVGSNPSKEVYDLMNLNPNIIVTGYVEDVRPFLSKSRLAVLPIRIARGIQNKILEAMAMAIPVVINEKLYASLSNLNRNDVFIYKDAEDLSKIILDNIGNENRLIQIGNKMRKYILEYYSWDFHLNMLKDYIK